MYVRTRKGHVLMGGSTVLGRPPASNKGLGLQASEGLGQVLRACPKCERFKVGKVAVWSLPAAVFFNAGMAIDADGAPNAYHPLDKGLDYLKNAGFPPPPGKRPWGIVIINGRPVIQGSGDPFPGYFVSGTSLVDKTRPQTDTRRYVDSAKIPYIALPEAPANKLCVKLGDFAAVVNPRNQRLSYAIFADIGPVGKLGEGSIALAQSLGHNPFVRGKATNGMADVIYVVFPGSGDAKPRSIAEIASNGERLFVEWGGMSRLFSCFPRLIRDLPVPSPSERYA